VTPFLKAAEKRYGEGTNLEDFIRRMQMQNYTHHRVMIEAFNSKLWKPATGVMLWMSHPAWPSMVWQLYTSDFEPNASFFGAKKASEPIHVQWNLNDDSISVVNKTYEAIANASLSVVVYDLDSRVLKTVTKDINIGTSTVISPGKVEWSDFATNPVQFVKLQLKDQAGKLLSENFYWHSDPAKPEQLRGLEKLPQVTLSGKVDFTKDRDSTVVTVQLSNPSKSVALMTHLVLRNLADNSRILPSYASDNYVTLMPGEMKTITISCSTKDTAKSMGVTLDGWNIAPITLR
jgi:hypothetical protein